MEKVRGRIRRLRHRLELPACLKPKSDMPSIIYTVLDRENGRSFRHLRRQSSCKETHRKGSYLRDDSKLVRDDCLGDLSSSLWAIDDELYCEKESGPHSWNVNYLADREGPTIRVATFDVALFALAPAIPPDHPCAAPIPTVVAAGGATHSFELRTSTHFLPSDSSSIFSEKSKSSSSNASSGMNSFSNSRESTDSSETRAILSRNSARPNLTYKVCSSNAPPKHSPMWKSSSSPSKTKCSRPAPKSLSLSPFKPAITKNNGCGNFYQSKLNPVFGLSHCGRSSKCLMDSLPSLFSDLLSVSDKGSDHEDGETYLPPPPNFCHDDGEEKLICSPSTFSHLDFSSCESGFQTPLHPEMFPSDSGPVYTYTSSYTNPVSPLNESEYQFHSPSSSIFSPMAPRSYSNHPEESSLLQSTSCSVASMAASILDILLEVDADIIALQEVRAEEERGMKPLSELAEALGMEYAYAESWAPEFGNAVLSRWPIKSASVQQILDETDYRNVLKVVVDVPLVGDLHVYCTQLDHLDEDWRMRQVDSFLHTVSASQPHILAGNLNSLDRSDYSRDRWEDIAHARKQDRKLSPRGDVLRKLVQVNDYKDAKVAMCDGEVEEALQLKGQGVDGTCQHGTRVDYILRSPKLPFDFVPGSYSVISSRGTSNHNLATVDLQPHCYM